MLTIRGITVLDFETKKIEDRPSYPPEPVGVALKTRGKKGRYLAWGHPTNNNCTKGQAAEILKKVWRDKTSVVMHNAKFDLEVAERWFGLTMLPHDRFEDTLLLAFLDDPYAYSYELKPLAARMVGMPPDERDRLKEWILANVPGSRPSTWGQHICDAPGDLVGEYAVGDVDRTEEIFDHLYSKVFQVMSSPYIREKRIIPVLVDMEKHGMRVDRPALYKDGNPRTGRCVVVLDRVDEWIYDYLKVASFNVDSGAELADALESAGMANGGFMLTPTGKRSTKKESLEQAVSDQLLVAALGYRGALSTCLRTFIQPWYALSEEDGMVHTQWNSTRQTGKGGARTGRISSAPNLQNIPTDFEKFEFIFEATKFFQTTGFPPLPSVRGYVIPDRDDHILLGRDYSSQELRFLAHYEDGDLAKKYQDDPKADLHEFVKDLINGLFPEIGIKRKQTKTVNFLKVYGGGAGKLAMKLGISLDQAKKIMDAYMTVLPGLKGLTREIKATARAREPIITIGGRMYYEEPAKWVDGKRQTFDYKLLNYLIQGSSADQTKEATINFYEHPRRGESRLLLTVHDEIVLCAPKKGWREPMRALEECMNDAFTLDVPMISDGEVGYRWSEMIEESKYGD